MGTGQRLHGKRLADRLRARLDFREDFLHFIRGVDKPEKLIAADDFGIAKEPRSGLAKPRLLGRCELDVAEGAAFAAGAGLVDDAQLGHHGEL